MAKAPKKTANVAQTTLAKIAGLLVEEAASNEEVAAVLEAAGLTVAAKGKGKADKKAKPEPKAAKGKKKKITAAQIVEAIEEGESLDLDGVDEEVLREAVIAAKLATKKKAGSLDEEELLELLNEELGGEDDEDGDDEDEEDEDDSDSDDEDGDDEDEEDDEDDEDEDEDDEDEEDDESPDLDEMDEDELRELAVSEKVFTKAQAKKKDEDELREALEEHFGGDEDGDDEDEEDEDDEDGQDLEDLDEDQLRALAIEEGVFTKAQAKKKDEDELREALEEHFSGEDDEDEDDEDFDDEDEDEDDE